MPKNFWKIVNDVIGESDIVLLILDARIVEHTRHPEIEKKITAAGKQILYVINKSDLVPKHTVEFIKKKLKPCVFISAKKHMGTNVLRSQIMKMGKGEHTTAGVLGYPNVGKSSVINALSGSGKAKVGHMPGKTVGVQKIRVSQKMYLLDTPGVIPFMEADEVKHLLIGSKDPQKAKDPDLAAEHLLEAFSYKLPEWYGVEPEGEPDELLEAVALKLNYLKSGNNPDLDRTARKILLDWQKGKII